MTETGPKTVSVPVPRAAFAGLSALLVIGLVLGASLNGAEAVIRELPRDSHREWTPVRQLTMSLAKAVRELVGGDTHKPAMPEHRVFLAAGSEAGALARAGDWPGASPMLRVRLELLDLPPPGVPA